MLTFLLFAFRRRGLGRALLLTIFQRLKGYGMDTALAGTSSGNAAAQRLFATLGFHPVDQLRWYTWDGQQDPRHGRLRVRLEADSHGVLARRVLSAVALKRLPH